MKVPAAPADAPSDGLYRIATVSKITGIPVPTIRVWEARHAVVQPDRSEGNVRLYKRADIERLALIKAAVDAGHAIGTLASLSNRQIKARFKDGAAGVAKTREGACKVLVFGAPLAAMLKTAWQVRSDVQLLASQPSLPERLDADFQTPPAADAIIIDAPVIGHTLPAIVRQLRSATQTSMVIVVYGIANRQVLARLDAANVIALPAPTDPAQLARICQLGLAIEPAPPTAFSQMLMHSAPPRRYSNAFLLQLRQMPLTVQCECPNHLADLLIKLTAFERYSLECESNNVKDAAMHAMMYSASGHCREFLEEVLRRLMVHEGIPEPRT
jgi:MerR family transcriptional regulator, light-induced transcriptional regulator